MQIFIGSNNITDIVVVDSYKMDKTQEYESFNDGNMVSHRIITAEKISGQFNVVLSEKNNCTLEQFTNIWNMAVTNGCVLATVYVTNTGKIETINAYYSITSQQHTLTACGTYLDILEIKLEER